MRHFVELLNEVVLDLLALFVQDALIELSDCLCVRVRLTTLHDFQILVHLRVVPYDSLVGRGSLEVLRRSVVVQHLSQELRVFLLGVFEWRKLHVQLRHHFVQVITLFRF